MTEQLVSFELAKYLKERGFNFNVNFLYEAETGNIKNKWIPGGIAAPTQPLVQTWLREKHNILVSVITAYNSITEEYDPLYSFKPSITIIEYVGENIFKTDLKYEMFHGLKPMSYEDAMELGLMEALKLIVK